MPKNAELKFGFPNTPIIGEYGLVHGIGSRLIDCIEDVFESLLGVEIYEKDDPHPDMRELARQRGHRVGRRAGPEHPPKAGT